MKIHVGQIYIEPGATFPFSHTFQNWISKELTKRVRASPAYIKAYGSDYELMFNLSAKSGIRKPEIKGPTVFRKTKDVEYSVFLPFEKKAVPGRDGYERQLRLLLDCVLSVLRTLGVDGARIENDSALLIEGFHSTPDMISTRKPLPPASAISR